MVDMQQVVASVLAEQERSQFAEQAISKSLSVRFKALRRFYKLADSEIKRAGRAEWGIDPYEIDWLSVFTPIERALWHDIRAANAVLYPQYPAGRFFVDFGNPVAKVAVECDGAAYHTDKAKDEARDAELRGLGWTVYRLTGSQCIRDFDEEAMQKSAPRQLIDRLVREWGIGWND